MTEACDLRRLPPHPEQLVLGVSRSRTLWHDNADRVLSDNASTFAVLPLVDLLRRDGPLSQFRARGYEVRVL